MNTVMRRHQPGSVLEDGPRRPLSGWERGIVVERVRQAADARLTSPRAVRIVDEMLSLLGADGCCDPSLEQIATRSTDSVSTVQRVLRGLRGLGIVVWVRRLRPADHELTNGAEAVEQTSNAYAFCPDGPPILPLIERLSDGHQDRQALYVESLVPVAAHDAEEEEDAPEEGGGEPELPAPARTVFKNRFIRPISDAIDRVRRRRMQPVIDPDLDRIVSRLEREWWPPAPRPPVPAFLRELTVDEQAARDDAAWQAKLASEQQAAALRPPCPSLSWRPRPVAPVRTVEEQLLIMRAD